MAPAASTANQTAAPAEAVRAGSALRAARSFRRLQLFNDYGSASARLFHAWRP